MTSTPSKRWNHFHTALQLAIQRAATDWTYEDFSDSFSLWCAEQPEEAKAVFNAVSMHMEKAMKENCEEQLGKYNVQENIDILHAVSTEARARRSSGQIGSDLWRERITPRAAVRAHALPILEREATELRETLKELEKENVTLYETLQENIHELKVSDEKAIELLDILDKVYEEWSVLPAEDMELWSAHTLEYTPPIPL